MDQPPSLPSDLHYEKWRRQIDNWINETTVDRRRQALMVRTKLAGRARDIALKMDAATLNQENGMDVLLGELDKALRRQSRRDSRAMAEENEREERERERVELERRERLIREKEEQLRQLREEREQEFREWQEQQEFEKTRRQLEMKAEARLREKEAAASLESAKQRVQAAYAEKKQQKYHQEEQDDGGRYSSQDQERRRTPLVASHQLQAYPHQQHQSSPSGPPGPGEGPQRDARKPKLMRPQSHWSQQSLLKRKKHEEERKEKERKLDELQKQEHAARTENQTLCKPGEEDLTPIERARKRAKQLVSNPKITKQIIFPKAPVIPISPMINTSNKPSTTTTQQAATAGGRGDSDDDDIDGVPLRNFGQYVPDKYLGDEEIMKVATRLYKEKMHEQTSVNDKLKQQQLLDSIVSKKPNGMFSTTVEINDFASREFLQKPSTLELLKEKTHCTVYLQGVYFKNETDRALDAQMNNITTQPLSLVCEGTTSGIVNDALRKIFDVNKGYVANPKYRSANYGLTATQPPRVVTMAKVLERLDIHFNPHPSFDLPGKLLGPDRSNFTYIEEGTDAEIYLRGKYSGHIDPLTGREEDDKPYIHIAHRSYPGLLSAKELLLHLINTIHKEYLAYLTSPNCPLFQQGMPNPHRRLRSLKDFKEPVSFLGGPAREAIIPWKPPLPPKYSNPLSRVFNPIVRRTPRMYNPDGTCNFDLVEVEKVEKDYEERTKMNRLNWERENAASLGDNSNPQNQYLQQQRSVEVVGLNNSSRDLYRSSQYEHHHHLSQQQQQQQPPLYHQASPYIPQLTSSRVDHQQQQQGRYDGNNDDDLHHHRSRRSRSRSRSPDDNRSDYRRDRDRERERYPQSSRRRSRSRSPSRSSYSHHVNDDDNNRSQHHNEHDNRHYNYRPPPSSSEERGRNTYFNYNHQSGQPRTQDTTSSPLPAVDGYRTSRSHSGGREKSGSHWDELPARDGVGGGEEKKKQDTKLAPPTSTSSTRRKFSEEAPKKKRKFSEKPEMFKKTVPAIHQLKDKLNSVVEKYNLKAPSSLPPKVTKQNDDDDDDEGGLFQKPTFRPNILAMKEERPAAAKTKSKAFIGALGTIGNIYDEDSDQSDDGE